MGGPGWCGLCKRQARTPGHRHFTYQNGTSHPQPHHDLHQYIGHIFCLAIMVVGGSWLVYTRFVLGQLSAALQIPVGYVYAIVPISGLLMTYYAIDDIAHLVKNYKTLKQA